MHGADRHTPVTVIENASRSDQRILSTTLDALPTALEAANMTGPALTFYGLAPRDAERAANAPHGAQPRDTDMIPALPRSDYSLQEAL